ncbi:hypothetical protein FJ365_01870 [Candidatus Dependentiae bacterium]|nr:hypothetical protein [Candidatus Dependentiae bacterium]
MLFHNVLILILSCTLLSSYPPIMAKVITKQKYDVKKLHLYRLLTPVNDTLKRNLHQLKTNEGSPEDLEVLLKASSMCSQVLTSMERLVFLFNTKAYEAISQFKWQFLSVCQTLKKHGMDIKPRHFRELGPRLKKFHLAIFNYYYTHKEFMDEQEVELFNEMNRFCSGLRFCLLPGADDYFDFSFIDMLTDMLFFKPLEWMADHKLLVAVGVGVITISIWYWHKYNKEKIQAEKFKKKAMKAGFEMRCQHAVQQSGAQCGAYSIVNGILLNAANPEEVLRQAAFVDIPAVFAQVRTEIEHTGDLDRLRRFPETPEWLAVDQVIALTQEPLFMQGLARALGAELSPHNRFIVMQGLPSQTLIPEDDYQHLYNSVQALATNQEPQTVIIFQGDATTDYTATPGHWVVMRLSPPALPRGLLQVSVCDSLYAQNLYANPYLCGVAEMYACRNIQPPAIYAGSFEIKTAYQRFEDEVLTNTQKCRLAFTDYTKGLARIYRENPAQFINPHGPLHTLCDTQFMECRNRSLTLQQTVIEVPLRVVVDGEQRGENVIINLHDITNFSAYLAWFASHQPAA